MFPVACGVMLLAVGTPRTTWLEAERLTAARQAVECYDAFHQLNEAPKEEGERIALLHVAAVRRLAEVERRAGPTPAGRLAAARGWYVRGRDLELYLAARAERGLGRLMPALEASGQRVDAELELLQAIAALPAGGPPVTAPLTPAPADFRATVTDGKPDVVHFRLPMGTPLKRFDRLTVHRPGVAGPVAEVAVLYVGGGGEDGGSGIVVPTAGPPAAVRVGDQLRP